MNAITRVRDGLVNFASRLGTAGDKASANTYRTRALSAEEIDAAYRTTWLGKIIDIKAEDSVREWRAWQASKEEIQAIEDEENRLMVRKRVMQADAWSMLRGGAAILLGGLPGSPDKEVVLDKVGKGSLKYIAVLTRNQISAGEKITDPLDPRYGEPKSYEISTGTAGAQTFHPSRIIRFVGRDLPDDFSASGWDGWGDPLWNSLRDPVSNADSIAAGIAALVQEAKVDVLKIPRLMENLQTAEYESLLMRRVQVANTIKSIMNALVLDSGNDEGKGGEEHETKQISFDGLPDIQDRALMELSGKADIPQTRLLGRAPQGMNATGDSDAQNYAAMVKARQELHLQPRLAWMDEILIRSALGARPKEIWYMWRPLYNVSEKEGAEIEKTYAEGFRSRLESGAISDDVLAKSELNRMKESGRYPGIDDAIDDAENEGIVDPDEAAEVERMNLEAENQSLQMQQAANDAAPRSLYVRRDVVNVAEIRKWAEAQGIPDLVPDLHVTVVHSHAPIDWIKAGNVGEWNQDKNGRITIPEGGPRVVEPLGGMSAVLMFASSLLSWRHEEIMRIGASHVFADYQPHISLTKSPVDLSKIEPYRGKIVLGPEIFEELKP